MIVAETPATGAGEANKQLARPDLGVAGTYTMLLRRIRANVFVYEEYRSPGPPAAICRSHLSLTDLACLLAPQLRSVFVLVS